MAAHKNREVKNCRGIEDGSVSGDCKDVFMDKYGQNREVKIGEVGERISGRDCMVGCMHK